MNHTPANSKFGHKRSGRSLWTDLCAIPILALLLLAGPRLHSQISPEPEAKPSANSAVGKMPAIKSFRIIQEKDGQAVEILMTRPLIPSLQTLSDPDRLVIDLPARLGTDQRRISVGADQITAIRADQFQQNPPVARIVVDLLAPRAYTWDAAGNRLVVHLGRDPGDARNSPFEPPTVPTLAPTPKPAVAAVRTTGSLAFTESDLGAGSAVTAGPDTAILSLKGGGEVQVCPGTTVAVTRSQNQRNLMLSMNTGALETHFALGASSDTVMTPDFRILLVGPGEFDYAISADSQGNTCVRALPGNTASAIVSEMIGDRTYQVKATDQLVFRLGQLDHVDMSVPLECGCPPPRDAPLRALNNLPTVSPAPGGALPPVNASPGVVSETADAASARPTGIPAPSADSAAPSDIRVQLEAPFVFRATGPPPAPVQNAGAPTDSRPGTAPSATNPVPPPANETTKPDAPPANPPQPRGFFSKLRGFFAALFH